MHLDGHITTRHAARSEAGVKPENQDALGLTIPDKALATTKGFAAAIADGVSSAEAAARASRLCVDEFLSEYFTTPETWTVKTSAEKILTALNRLLVRRGQRYSDAQKGYVCTLSVLIFKSHQLHLFHVGDTRIYRWRDKKLQQLTRDHAVQINEKDTFLSRAMGLDPSLQVDYHSETLQARDIYLMTTDGIHDFLTEKQLIQALQHNDPKTTCDQLIQNATDAHSNDNLSCQVISIDALPQETPDDLNRRLTQLPFPPDLNPGMILDGYHINHELHASPRSQLYQVTDTQSGDTYMMKTPSANYSDDPAYIERFMMESWIGSRIQSPHVMRIIDLPRPRTCLYYLAEYIPGLPLASWIRQNPHPPIEQIIPMAEELVQGLRALQRKETLHQDIKPDNIMIDADGHIKIVDFGSCYIAGIDAIRAPITRQVILGTIDYAAPEYQLGIRATIQSDQFSLAAVIYEILTGHRPYGNQLGKAKKDEDFLKLKYAPAFHSNPQVPRWIDGTLKKALSIKPQDRYEALSEFIHDLKKPNPAFLQETRKPLIERNPVGFWKTTTLLLALLCALLAFKLKGA